MEILCVKSPYLYLKPYPHAGSFKVAMESKNQDASLPKPPFPSAIYFSYNRYGGNNYNKVKNRTK